MKTALGRTPAALRRFAGAPVRASLVELPGRLVRGVIHVYRFAISPLLGPRCRFHPTCSEYALEAVGRFGAARGGWLALCRIARCHPWHPGGVDHVPGHRAESDTPPRRARA